MPLLPSIRPGPFDLLMTRSTYDIQESAMGSTAPKISVRAW
jgi:hypothetical protein